MNKSRKKNTSLVIISIISIFTGSCNLDLAPYDGIPHGNSWQTFDDAVRFRNGLYSDYRYIQGGRYMYSDVQADLFNATIGFGNRQGDLHTWNFSNSQYDIEAYWYYNYVTINNANNVINNIDKIGAETDDQKTMLSTIKGEAFFMRALCYHALAIRFAKDYEPSSASSDLGLPVVIQENEVENKPARSTLQETYDFIKNDIAEAEKLLPATKTQTGRLSMDALNLFNARVDLYMHNYQEAITNADKVIPQYTLITSKEDLGNMWLNDEGSEIIFQPEQNADERANSLASYLNYSTGSQSFQPDYIPAQWVVDLYESSDIRLDATFLRSTVTSSSQREDDVYMLNKYPGNPALKRTPDEFSYFNKIKIFRTPEALLIAAEAAYLSNQPASAALGYLNTLRNARGASEFANLSGTDLFDEIKNEWIREYLGEAKRLDDFKRWHEGFTRHDSQNKSVVLTGDNFNTKSVEADNIRFVWEIPGNDLTVNTNLKPNW